MSNNKRDRDNEQTKGEEMIRKKIKDEVYAAMGYPDLGSRIFLLKDGKRIFGKVCLLSFIGFKGARDGKVLIGIEPFNNKEKK